MYWIKTPWFLKKIFRNYTWDKSEGAKKVYLTFDDGPIPEITEWIIDLLKSHEVKATFFCVGDNIQKYPDVFDRLLSDGHCVGNHTFNHDKGWETDNGVYAESINRTQVLIDQIKSSKGLDSRNKIFRPPYGKLVPAQSDEIRSNGYEIVMWDILSADFDLDVSSKKCLRNVISNTSDGSIVVFHDNVKSFKTIQYVLPRYLKFLKKRGYELATIY